MLSKQQLFDMDKLISCYLMDLVMYIVVGFVLVSFGAYISDTLLQTTYTNTFSLHTCMTVVIYAEILAMLTKYLESHEIPIEFVTFLVITAIARNILVNIEKLTDISLIANALGIFVSIAALTIYRYCYNKKPAKPAE